MKYYVTRDKVDRSYIEVWMSKPQLSGGGMFHSGDGAIRASIPLPFCGLVHALGVPIPAPGECIEWEVPEKEAKA